MEEMSDDEMMSEIILGQNGNKRPRMMSIQGVEAVPMTTGVALDVTHNGQRQQQQQQQQQQFLSLCLVFKTTGLLSIVSV